MALINAVENKPIPAIYQESFFFLRTYTIYEIVTALRNNATTTNRSVCVQCSER